MNFTFSSSNPDDLLHHCWRLPNCETCLSSPQPCSWCPISSTCVPNTVFRYPFQLLSPLKTQFICPLAWRERWELRAKPFSCRCSTMTLMSVVVAVLATLLGVLLIWASIKLGRWSWKAWKRRQSGWWKLRSRAGEGKWQWTWKWQRRKDDAGGGYAEDERQALLDGG